MSVGGFHPFLRRPHVGITVHSEQKLHLHFFHAFGTVNKYCYVPVCVFGKEGKHRVVIFHKMLKTSSKLKLS